MIRSTRGGGIPLTLSSRVSSFPGLPSVICREFGSMLTKSPQSNRLRLLAAATTGLALLVCGEGAVAQGTSIRDDLLGPDSERRVERQGQPTAAEGDPTTPSAVGEKAATPSGIAQPEPFGANLFSGAAPAVSDRPN